MTAEVAPPARSPAATNQGDDGGHRRLRVALRTTCPPLAERVGPLAERLSSAYETRCIRLQGTVNESHRFDPVESTDSLALKAVLGEPLEEALLAEMSTAADHHADAVERRLEARLEPDVDVSIDLDCEGFTERYARRALDRVLVAAETDCVRRLRAARAGADDPRRATAVAFADLLATEPRRLATAGLLLAARAGAQALAAGTDVVTAKRWDTLEDLGCPLHAGVDGATVSVDRCFAVDHGTVRRSAFLVGEDAPLVCSCVQRAVVGDQSPSAPRALATHDGVSVRLGGDPVSPLSNRQREVFREHARPGESFPALLQRVHDEYSVRGGARELGVAKKTLYRWFDTHIDDFDRYNGR